MKKAVKNKKRKLRTGMIRVIMAYWIIPYIVVSSVLIVLYNGHSQQQVGNTVCTAMENAGLITADKIYAAIELSRQASYDGVIKKSYEQFLKDGDERSMYREVTDYLNRTYKYSKTISNTILLYDPPVTMEYYTYSNVAGATYASIDEFKNAAAEAVRLAARDLDTRTRLIDISGHLYVVRNIVRSNYQPFVTLVMEVNKDRLFESMDGMIWKKSGIIMLDGTVLRFSGSDGLKAQSLAAAVSEAAGMALQPREGETAACYDRKKLQAVAALKINGQMLWAVNELDRAQLVGDRTAFISVYIVALVMLIPLLIATLSYLHRNINKPVGDLVKASDIIRGGEYGYCVEPFDKNEEMGQLVDTFNHMSVSLEDSFKRIYVEEIAERDATLKALQSQINPHFLNNTLEIINWKARLSGNEDVSEMIAALSVMMNATLNRNNEMFIPISEELSYVDAYLYIIQERFGSKFHFEKVIDEKLLDVKIPRLIIQPIVENAVEHGGDSRGNIEGCLKIEKSDDETILIIVENNGSLSGEDRKRIERLLSDDKLGESERLDRMSIGIRNVNLRLRLLYGDDSGLEIEDDGKGKTISRIRIRKS